jgi:hypothetical protein
MTKIDSKINYTDLLMENLLPSIIGSIVGNFVVWLSLALFFRGIHIPWVGSPSSVAFNFIILFFINFYQGYRLQKFKIKNNLLNTFENSFPTKG